MHDPVAARRLAYRLIAIAALLAFFFLALDTASRKAVTTDEPLHLTHSISMRQLGGMPLPEMHTPLTYRLIGGLLATEPPLPAVTELKSWPSLNPYDISRELMWRDDLATDRVTWLARFVVAGMGVILGAVIAAWTASLTRGHRPALVIVMSLFALSPNLLASAALATTDIAAAATWLLCVYTWQRYWRRPGWARWWLAAVCLGLALAAKLTGVLLLPITLALSYVYPQPGRRFWEPALIWLGAALVAGLVLWASYGFEMAGRLPLPAYVEAWRLLLHEVDVSHTNFFLGRVSDTGSWFYFPVTLLLKTPLLQLALFLLIPLVLWWERRRWRTLTFLALPAGFFLAVSAVSRLSFGYRHALPAVPYLMILGALAVPRLWARPPARAVLLLALAWTAFSAVGTHPDHLAYFNELAGGRGYRYLGDSNLDWGQDLNQLAAYAARARAETGRPLFFSYNGTADRPHYGLTGPSLTEQFNSGAGEFAPANPPPGRYAINTGDLQGTGLILGELRESALYDWFRRQEPVDTLGGSILIYDVPQQAEGEWIAHCLSPGPLLAEAAAERLVGRAGLRHVRFDCHSNWVFPGGDASAEGAPGWYILPPGEGWWINDWLYSGRISNVYSHAANEFGPAYEVYYWPGSWSAAALLSGVAPAEPLLAGTAELWAYLRRDAEWGAQWRVAAATSEPLSIQAHLSVGDGSTQVADGLGFSADQWRPGDWFIQRHVFDALGEELDTGLYNYVTLEPASERVRLPAR